MKKLIVLFVFISSFLFCSAGQHYNTDSNGKYLSPSGHARGSLWVSSDISVSGEADLYIDSFDYALSHPNELVSVQRTEAPKRLKLFFKKIVEKKHEFIVYSPKNKNINLVERDTCVEENSILILFWLVPIFLMMLILIIPKIKRIAKLKLYLEILYWLSVIFMCCGLLVSLPFAFSSGGLVRFYSLSIALAIFSTALLFVLRKSKGKYCFSDMVVTIVLYMLSLVFILL